MAIGSADSTWQTIAATAPFSPRTPEQNVSKWAEEDKPASYSLGFFGDRPLHTGEVAGSIPAAPTMESTTYLICRFRPPRKLRDKAFFPSRAW
jgi:hypothetical protein